VLYKCFWLCGIPWSWLLVSFWVRDKFSYTVLYCIDFTYTSRYDRLLIVAPKCPQFLDTKTPLCCFQQQFEPKPSESPSECLRKCLRKPPKLGNFSSFTESDESTLTAAFSFPHFPVLRFQSRILASLLFYQNRRRII